MLEFATIILLISCAILIFCVIRGPEIQHRVIAADAFAVVASMLIVMFAIKQNETSLYDICIIFALLAFADVLILTKYFEKGELQK